MTKIDIKTPLELNHLLQVFSLEDIIEDTKHYSDAFNEYSNEVLRQNMDNPKMLLKSNIQFSDVELMLLIEENKENSNVLYWLTMYVWENRLSDLEHPETCKYLDENMFDIIRELMMFQLVQINDITSYLYNYKVSRIFGIYNNSIDYLIYERFEEVEVEVVNAIENGLKPYGYPLMNDNIFIYDNSHFDFDVLSKSITKTYKH